MRYKFCSFKNLSVVMRVMRKMMMMMMISAYYGSTLLLKISTFH